MAEVVHLTSVHTPFDTRIFHKECKTLAQAGYDVVLAVPHSRDEAVDGVRIRALPIPRSRLGRMIRTVWHVYQAARAEDAEIYHFHDPELIPVGLLLRMRGKTVIYDMHEDYVTSIRQKGYLPLVLRWFMAGLWGKAEQAAGKAFQLVLAEKYYSARFPAGIPILNYPVREHFAMSEHKSENRLALLYTGVVSQNRGALLHSRIVTLVDDVEVYVVGRCSKDLAEKMRQIAGTGRERLRIEGESLHVPYDRVLDYYARDKWLAGLAIFPPTPHYLEKELTKLFEYMGAGIPVICSDFPAWHSLMEDTGAGLCVDPLNPEAIAAAVRYLMEHPDEAQQMASNARRAFETKYNWDSEAKKLIDLYHSLVP